MFSLILYIYKKRYIQQCSHVKEIVETNVDQEEDLITHLTVEKAESESLSIFERIRRSFPSTKRKSSDSSTGSDDRRESLRSTSSLGSGLDSRRASSASTFGNHGTMAPQISIEDDSVGPKKERCPLSRCLLSREARIRKKSLSQHNFMPSLNQPVPKREEYLLHTGNGLLMFPNRV